MKKPVLIISYVPNYNRQGYDLADTLRDLGYPVRLYQMDGITDNQKGIFGIRCVKPTGRFHKLIMIRNLLAFVFKTLFVRKPIVICIGKPMLRLGGFYSLVFGSKLIWYSLEYSQLGIVDRIVYQKCVSGYIDVEENRRDAVFSQYGRKATSLVCYNMPHLHKTPILGGSLRKFLKEKYGFNGCEQLVVYAGSYQKYACLENIVRTSMNFPKNRKLVLMAYGLPDAICAKSDSCITVPPVKGEEFYAWLADADCALLPYETDDNFNVLNCSPQKIFDCYCVGVPYLASDRPIIRKVLHEYPSAGAVCNYTKVKDIEEQIDAIMVRKSAVRESMRTLHVEKFNYDQMLPHFKSLMGDLDE
jgi:hypothetical protein